MKGIWRGGENLGVSIWEGWNNLQWQRKTVGMSGHSNFLMMMPVAWGGCVLARLGSSLSVGLWDSCHPGTPFPGVCGRAGSLFGFRSSWVLTHRCWYWFDELKMEILEASCKFSNGNTQQYELDRSYLRTSHVCHSPSRMLKA